MSDQGLPYKRILLKISGEVLRGSQSHGYDSKILGDLATTIKKVKQTGIELCLVVGGGNFFRGAEHCAELISRVGADSIGMMATVMNGVALQDALKTVDVEAKLVSNQAYAGLTEVFNASKHQTDVAEGKVIIFVGGLSMPYLTTDTCGVVRALEMNCDCMFKATKFPGVYDINPAQNPDAKHYANLSYSDVDVTKLGAMDQTACVLAKENNLELIVYSLLPVENILKIIQDDSTVLYTRMK